MEPTMKAGLDLAGGMKAVPGPLVQIGEGRKDTRAGSYDRHLQTRAGDVTLTAPKLRSLPFKTAIIERYPRRESPVEEALIEMYLAAFCAGCEEA